MTIDDPRATIRAALAEEDPITALRSVAIDLSATLTVEVAIGAFMSVCEELAAEGQDEDAANVAYVIDMVEEWRAKGKAWF